MTQNQSALSTLLTELLDDPDMAHDQVFRRLLQAGLQDLIDAEATAKIGAGRYERSSARTTRRNGSRSKTLETPAGEVNLEIPKLRQGSFFPALLHSRRRGSTRPFTPWSPKPGSTGSPPARSTS